MKLYFPSSPGEGLQAAGRSPVRPVGAGGLGERGGARAEGPRRRRASPGPAARLGRQHGDPPPRRRSRPAFKPKWLKLQGPGREAGPRASVRSKAPVPAETRDTENGAGKASGGERGAGGPGLGERAGAAGEGPAGKERPDRAASVAPPTPATGGSRPVGGGTGREGVREPLRPAHGGGDGGAPGVEGGGLPRAGGARSWRARSHPRKFRWPSWPSARRGSPRRRSRT